MTANEQAFQTSSQESGKVRISSFSTSTASVDANQTTIATTTTCITTTMTPSSSSSSPKASFATTLCPTELDVICGRGGGSNSHSGNVAFRGLIQSKKAEYQALTSRNPKKREIGNAIVAMIHNNGGRFVQQDKSTNWLEVDDERALTKTLQALRERNYPKKKKKKNPSRYASSSSKWRFTNRRPPKAATKPKPPRCDSKPHLAAAANRHPKPSSAAALQELDRSDHEGSNALENEDGCEEWKLFDFCDEEPTKLDAPWIPQQQQQQQQQENFHPSLSMPQQQLHPPRPQAQAKPAPFVCMQQMLASSRLSGKAKAEPLAPPASMPESWNASTWIQEI